MYNIYRGSWSDMREGSGELLYANCEVEEVESFCRDRNIPYLEDFLEGIYFPPTSFGNHFWLEEAM